MRSLRALALASALVVAPAAAHAQAPAPATPTTPAALPYRQVITVNPLGIVFGGLSGDYERRIAPARTVGVGGSYYALDGFSYSALEAKYRWYPNGTALRGFSLGAIGGFVRGAGSDDDCTGVCTDESATAATLGINLDYQWLLGARRNFAVATGIGAKRFFGLDLDGASAGLPTIRLAVGWAF